jgi:SAM-dependent methyltransferase
MAGLKNLESKNKSIQKQERAFWESQRKSGEEINLRYARDLPDDTPEFILRMMSHFEEEVARFSFEGCFGRVLDAGCGNGNILVRSSTLTNGISPYNGSVRFVGLDFSRNMLGMAAARSQGRNVTFTQGCINYLPFKDQTFDRVISSGVLTCLPSVQDAKASLEEFYRVLKPGGILVVDFFNQLSHFTRVRKALFKEEIAPPEYISPSSFRALLEDAGFKIQTYRGFDYKLCQGYLFMSKWRFLVDPCFVQERFTRFVEAKVVPKLPGISHFSYRIYVKCIK